MIFICPPTGDGPPILPMALNRQLPTLALWAPPMDHHPNSHPTVLTSQCTALLYKTFLLLETSNMGQSPRPNPPQHNTPAMAVLECADSSSESGRTTNNLVNAPLLHRNHGCNKCARQWVWLI
eukprot:scaffold70986_cov23-Cyclotella_meneghiniana.AAC.1